VTAVIDENKYPNPVYKWLTNVLQTFVTPTLVPSSIDTADRILSAFAKTTHSLFLWDLGFPNAVAEKLEAGEYRIGFTPEIIFALYEAALLYAAVLEGDEKEPIGTAMPIRMREGAFYDYDFILGGAATIHLDDKFRLNISSYFSNLPKRNDYKILARLLFDFALAWVCLHERAHILKGHVDYVRYAQLGKLYESPVLEAGYLGFSEKESLYRRCLEMDADVTAAIDLLTRNTQPSIWTLYRVCPRPKNDEEAIILSVAMIIVAMAVLKKIEMTGGISPEYPTTEERIAYSVLNLASYYARPSELRSEPESDEWKAVLKGCLQAQRFLDRTNKYLPSFTFNQEHGFTATRAKQTAMLNAVLSDNLRATLSDIVDKVFIVGK